MPFLSSQACRYKFSLLFKLANVEASFVGCRVDLDGKLHCYLVVSDLTHGQSNMQACPDNTDVAIINNQEEFYFLWDLLANRMS